LEENRDRLLNLLAIFTAACSLTARFSGGLVEYLLDLDIARNFPDS
jgi:hypothetical protein